MGGDGGAIANNRRYLPQSHMNQVKDTEEKDRYTVDRQRWAECHLSKRPLMPPLVADELGNLYCKEAVLSALQQKQAVAPHVRGLRDVAALKPQPNPSKKEAHAALAAGDDGGSAEELQDLWRCPVTQLTTNGSNKFMFGWTCGCVFAARCMHQIGGGEECPVCGAASTTDWENISCSNLLIPLCPDKDTTEKLQKNMHTRRALVKEKRKGKKDGEPAAKRPRRKVEAVEMPLPPPPSHLVMPEVGRDAPPPGADPEVWKTMFRGPQTCPEGVGEHFLRRGGMLGPSHKAT
eukprot:TRINITY_DN36632_c0_g1_i1.p2 TRINITY_DN36632_c0_g1~~TRINITY_DN36632_c0_g1_i1.p2  ORF type:complete len:309 (+),score=116.05 TRINITY_DN36632_c0_g1_i1:57-929(+)